MKSNIDYCVMMFNLASKTPSRPRRSSKADCAEFQLRKHHKLKQFSSTAIPDAKNRQNPIILHLKAHRVCMRPSVFKETSYQRLPRLAPKYFSGFPRRERGTGGRSLRCSRVGEENFGKGFKSSKECGIRTLHNCYVFVQ